MSGESPLGRPVYGRTVSPRVPGVPDASSQISVVCAAGPDATRHARMATPEEIQMKRTYFILPVVVAFVVLGYVFRSPAGALILRSERIDAPAFSAMMSCIFDPVREITLDIDRRYTIPLPDRTARFGDGRFLTETVKGLQEYVNRLEDRGWVHDQLGSMYVFTRRDGPARFELSVRPFTGMYYVLTFRAVDRAQTPGAPASLRR